jgi:putative nucleotidyltransferase with HDIG domain
LIASPPPLDLGRASGVQSLPPFSPVVCRLCQLITDERVHFREVAQVFALDAALSSRVLRVANSALLGCRHQIASILQAVMMVGADRVRDIAVTVAMKNYMGEEDNTFLHRCWRHNLATALWCERLVEYCDLEPSAAYTAGLLHDIGRTALLMLFPRDYAVFMDHSLTGGLDKREAERKLCDADHCQIGHKLSASWNFPSLLIDVIANHHEEATPEAPGTRLLVQAACAAASISGFHAVGPQPAWDPARIDRLLPRGRAANGPNYEHLLDTIALKLNQTECTLL